MGRVRVFYGHEGVVPPTGLRSRSAADPAPEDAEVDEVVSDDLGGAPVELVGEVIEDDGQALAPAVVEYVDGREVEVDEDGVPVLAPIEDDAAPVAEVVAEVPDKSWTVPEIEAWAEGRVDLSGAAKKAEKLALISEYIKEQ